MLYNIMQHVNKNLTGLNFAYSPAICNEVLFWQNNIDSIYGKHLSPLFLAFFSILDRLFIYWFYLLFFLVVLLLLF